MQKNKSIYKYKLSIQIKKANFKYEILNAINFFSEMHSYLNNTFHLLFVL